MTYPAPPPLGYGPNPDDLSLPLRGATISQAATRFFKKYATFTGRASRSEYWYWVLISLLVGVVFAVIDSLTSGGFARAGDTVGSVGDIFSYLWTLATLVPSLALNARRLHDIDRSGWWQLIVLIPLVGAIVFIVWMATPPKPAGVTRDPGYQAGYGGQPQVGPYAGGPYPGDPYGGGPAGGQYGAGGGQYGASGGQYGAPGAYGGPSAPGAYGGPSAPGAYGGPSAPGAYGGPSAPGAYGGSSNDPFGSGQQGPGPTNDPSGPPTNDPYGSGPTQH